MYKKVIILLSFLAYSLTLVHSLVPHHHHQEAKADHHHHGSDKNHHHEEHDEKKSLGHVLADAIHHPASEFVIHTPESNSVQKKKQAVDVLIFTIGQLIFSDLKPPDIPTQYQENHYSSNEDSFFLLRAPPVA